MTSLPPAALALLLLKAIAHAEEPVAAAAVAPAEPVHVKVGLYVLNTIGLNLFLSVHMMRLMQLKREPAAARVRELSFKLIPAFAAFSYLIGALS